MIVKKHVHNGRLLLAVCDNALIGKKISDGSKILDLSSDFYCGEEKTKDDVLKLMKQSYMIILIGSESLKTAKEIFAVPDNNVIFVKGIPHAQILFVGE